ncbi:MAG: PAS domain S-box protein [Polaromonas sp.]|nr:MAG: PAS domain S-box protein [Polaromonas sp.]
MTPAPIPDNDAQRLAELDRYEILDTGDEAEFDDFARLAAQICNVPIALISLVDKDRQWFKSRVGLDVLQTARDISFCGHAVTSTGVFEVQDTAHDPRFADNPLVAEGLAIRFYAGAPLLTQSGLAIGTLCVIDTQPKTLSSEQINALEALSRQVVRQLDLRLLVRRQKAQNLELAGQRNFQKMLFDSATAGVVSITADGQITSMNAAFEQLVGYAAAELVHRGNIRLFHLEDELVTRAKTLSLQLARPVEPEDSIWAGAMVGVPNMRDWTYRCKDGSCVSVLVSISPLVSDGSEFAPGGMTNGFVVVVWDITERNKAHEEVIKLNADLEARVARRTAELERKTQDLELLSYSIAHDLRQPLITISGNTHLLKKQALDAVSLHHLERIGAGVHQLSVRSDALLYFADLSHRQLKRGAVDLAQIAREQLLRLQQDEPGREVAALVPPHLPTWADKNLMTEAVNELVLNAWKFTAGRDSGSIEVGLRVGENGEYIYFVKDNGSGFDMAHVHTLFEPFQYIETVEGSAGHGIGLAKVKRIVAKHGGRLWAESQVNEGSVFYFTLSGV